MQGRLRQALSYPAMIFLVAMVASVVVSVGLWLINPFFRQLFDAMLDGGRLPLLTQVVLGPRWLVASAPVVLLMPVAVLAVLVATAKRWRAWARWKWPVWREISLMQFASSMALLLGHGVRLDDAVTVLQQQEKGTVLGGELARWQADLAGGKSDFVRIAFPSDVLPLFFMGLVSTGGGDLAAGFRVATDVYREMAYCKLDRVLNVFVPVLVVLAYLHVLLPIAAMIFGLFLPLVELMSCLC
jgi:type II secretory pathway component PulF